jgi:hypothetical protein
MSLRHFHQSRGPTHGTELRRLALWLLPVAAVLPAAAMADSDSLMCVGPKYLALESRSFDSDGQHRLLIYWLHDGIGPEHSVHLPDFQAHGLGCSTRTIQVRDWEEIHEIDVSISNQPRYIGPLRTITTDQVKAAHRSQNIATWPSGRLDLADVSDGTHYVLEVSNSPAMHPGIVETTTIAKLVRLSSEDGFVESRIIYAATSVETID